MKVTKWIDMGQEVEVEVTTADIRDALEEGFSGITQDRLGEPGPSANEVHQVLNDIGRFFNALTDEHIRTLSASARQIVGAYLAKAANRFSEAKS